MEHLDEVRVVIDNLLNSEDCETFLEDAIQEENKENQRES